MSNLVKFHDDGQGTSLKMSPANISLITSTYHKILEAKQELDLEQVAYDDMAYGLNCLIKRSDDQMIAFIGASEAFMVLMINQM